MPKPRPPPLPKSLFEPAGPLAPGSAKPPPSPTSIHPEYIVDSHSFPDRPTTDAEPILGGLEDSYPRPPVKSVVQVKMDVSAEPAQEVLGVKPFSIHPTILNLTLATPPSITNIAKGAVDIIVPSTYPMTEKEWDLLDEAVNALEGTWGSSEAPPAASQEGSTPVRWGNGEKIVISGLLPPPLTKPSSSLIKDETYNLHLARLAQLSLQANVYLKALPPIVDTRVITGEKWWNEQKELERVLRMYLGPSIETFGTHRIVFGSSPALPLADLALATLNETALEQPISSDRWYGILRKAITEMGEDQEATNSVLGATAAMVYQLD